MAHYQVILAYDGTLFEGFQRQAERRTVQGEVENALRRLGWAGRSILSAGRTDTGVHASGQVVAFDLDWAHPARDLLQALNANLPGDIAARSVQVVSARFHPRYDAIARRYHYCILCDEARNPMEERYAWRVWPPLRLHQLEEAARLLTGRYDFAAFGSPPRPKGSTIREVFAAGWDQSGEILRFEIKANAFLYHMVRRLVFLQVLIGQGRLALEDFRKGLTEQRPLTPGLAPPQGLSLVEVIYPMFDAGSIRVDNHVVVEKTLAVSGEDDCGQDLRPER